MEAKIMQRLNAIFEISEKSFREKDQVLKNANKSNLILFTRPQDSLEEAALNWMLVEIESYLNILTSRKCTNIKVWKTVSQWNEFDVYFHIQAKGREVPEFALKAYVVFSEKDKCQFKLEDWANGLRGYVNGRVNKLNGTFQCQQLPAEGEPPSLNYYEDYYWDTKVQT